MKLFSAGIYASQKSKFFNQGNHPNHHGRVNLFWRPWGKIFLFGSCTLHLILFVWSNTTFTTVCAQNEIVKKNKQLELKSTHQIRVICRSFNMFMSAAESEGCAADVWAAVQSLHLMSMLMKFTYICAAAQLSHASGAVTLRCSGGRESVLRDDSALFHFSDGTSDTSAGAYRMLIGGKASKSKRRTESRQRCILGRPVSVGGWGHYAAPLSER